MNPDDPMIRGNETAPRPDAAADGSGEDDILPRSTPVANAGRVGTVLYEPEATFESVRQKPDWLIPLLLLVGLSLLYAFLVGPKIDLRPAYVEAIDRQAESQGWDAQEREERVDAAMAITESLKKPVLTLVTAPFGLVFFTLVLWGSMRAAGGDSTFMQSFSVILYSWMPQALKSIVVMGLMIPRDSIDARYLPSLLKSNPGAFLNPVESPILAAALSSLDLFKIWTVILLVIGLAVINRFSKTKVAIFLVIVYVLFFIILPTGLAAVSASMSL